jgi:hypothetical protein
MIWLEYVGCKAEDDLVATGIEPTGNVGELKAFRDEATAAIFIHKHSYESFNGDTCAWRLYVLQRSK